MEVIKLPKKFRTVCDEIRDGSYESLEKLESFTAFPHQVAAVKAAVAYFDKDYNTAVDLTCDIMPFWDEWYYSNVPDEFMAAMVFAARECGKEEQVRKALTEERYRSFTKDVEKYGEGKHPRYKYCNSMLNFLDTGIMHKNGELNYSVPANAKSVDEVIRDCKIKDGDKEKLYKMLCLYGYPEDAVKLYEEIKEGRLSEYDRQDAIVRYLYLNEDEKALQAIERLASDRLWTVASPAQVRPMCFFTHPMMHKFLKDDECLERIRKASLMNTWE